jgi:hypothetical protein
MEMQTIGVDLGYEIGVKRWQRYQSAIRMIVIGSTGTMGKASARALSATHEVKS